MQNIQNADENCYKLMVARDALVTRTVLTPHEKDTTLKKRPSEDDTTVSLKEI